MAPNRKSRKGKNPIVASKARKNIKKKKSTSKGQNVQTKSEIRKSKRIGSARNAVSRIAPALQLSGTTISDNTTHEQQGFTSRGTQYETVPGFQYNQIEFLVFDTNVLMKHLHIIQKCTKATINDLPVVAYIPYRVLIELDGLHHSSNKEVENQAGNAIRYLFQNLNKLPTLRGQSQDAMESWKKYGLKDAQIRTSDDEIMEAAIGLVKEGITNRVIMVTDDKNLINKCRVNLVITETTKTLKKKICT